MKPMCPKCSGIEVLRIMYGLPTDEAIEEAQAGKIALGGCVVEESNPDWECKSCGYRWIDDLNRKSA
jgi:hypothetical protein